MKTSYLTLLPILSLLLGCETNPIREVANPVGEPLSFVGSKSVGGFVASADFASGSKIGLYLTPASAGLAPTGNHAHNALFLATVSGFSATGITYPEGVASLDFYAYAPYASTAIGSDRSISFSVAPDQTSPEGSDLLWMRKQGVASGSIPTLVFDHKLSQIVVVLTAGPGVVLANPVVTLVGTLPTASLNIETGVLGHATGVSVPIVPTNIADNEMHAIVVPQTMPQNTSFIWVVHDGKTFKHALPKEQTFVSGYSYRYEITVKERSIDVTFTGSVNGWNPGDSTTGDAV